MASLATRLEQLIKDTSDRRCSDRVPGETVERFVEKLGRKTAQYASPLRDVTDLIGIDLSLII